MSKLKYGEDEFLRDTLRYIAGTYKEHYAHELNDRGMQLYDLWDGLGSLETTARDTAIKYLTRFGRKDGHNIKDLYKAIHYISIIAYCAQRDQEASKSSQDAKKYEEPSEAEDRMDNEGGAQYAEGRYLAGQFKEPKRRGTEDTTE